MLRIITIFAFVEALIVTVVFAQADTTAAISCFANPMPIQFDASTHASRTTLHEFGSLVTIHHDLHAVNIGYLDVVTVNSNGELVSRLPYAELDSIADILIEDLWGPYATIKRHTSRLDSVLCTHTIFTVRGIRHDRASGRLEALIAVIAEGVQIREGRAFENMLFTVTLDYDLGLCSAAFIRDSGDLIHGSSSTNGFSSDSVFIDLKEQNIYDTANYAFNKYVRNGTEWVLKGPFTTLRQGANVAWKFMGTMPVGLPHPKGLLSSNGRIVVVTDMLGETIETWTLEDADTRPIDIIKAGSDVYITKSYVFDGRFADIKDPYHYIEVRDAHLNTKYQLARYDWRRFRVNDFDVYGAQVVVMLYDRISKRHLLQTLALDSTCENRTFR